MAIKNGVSKANYVETVSGLAATLAGQAVDSSDERQLNYLSQTQVDLEIVVTFDASADAGLQVELLEGMASGAQSTQPAHGNSGIVDLVAGSTERCTFHFEVWSEFYTVRLTNLDSDIGRNATNIVVKVLEFPEGV